MTERDRAFLRDQLATIGIFLPDDPREAAPETKPAAKPVTDDVDRDFVREALIRAGAPDRDLEWLVRSCPDELAALGYRAPLPEAFCAVHNGPQPTDRHGCVLCRSVDLPNPPPEPTTKKAT